ncbi:hypothetical protein PR048_028418 [Dryococelus australis]|uniref:Reverse transcriptase domain-containing protein n=1 Tax=Dryococelus australis TaxID=614101 RepID=A0ABQ9GDA6_9NEOP|nr:hypothetical protein PR048_028418 [Dryococelus australis]
MSYLEACSFHISVEGEKSKRHHINAGVPQGSLLGLVLINLYINDLPAVEGAQICCNADETIVFATPMNRNRAITLLQAALYEIEPWLAKWRIKANSQKTEAIVFNTQIKPPPRKLQLYSQYIDRVKYLAKANSQLRQLFPLLHRPSSLLIRNDIIIYQSLLGPILTYAAPVWGQQQNHTSRGSKDSETRFSV